MYHFYNFVAERPGFCVYEPVLSVGIRLHVVERRGPRGEKRFFFCKLLLFFGKFRTWAPFRKGICPCTLALGWRGRGAQGWKGPSFKKNYFPFQINLFTLSSPKMAVFRLLLRSICPKTIRPSCQWRQWGSLAHTPNRAAQPSRSQRGCSRST